MKGIIILVNIVIYLGFLNIHILCAALKSNGNVITDSLSKAEILNPLFKSVFTPQSGNTFPQLSGTQFPKKFTSTYF